MGSPLFPFNAVIAHTLIGNLDASYVQNAPWLSESQFNNTLNAVNTTANIQSLGFSTTAQLSVLFIPYVGATRDVDLGSNSLTTTGVVNDRGMYGEMVNTSQGTMVLPAQGAWYDVSGLVLDDAAGVAVSNNALVVGESGKYLITYTFYGSVNSSDVIEGQLTDNRVAFPSSYTANKYAAGMNSGQSTTFIAPLKAGEVLNLQVRDVTGAGAAYTYINRGVSITKIGS
jgi:hypothetical protein